MRAIIMKSEPHFWDYKHIGDSFEIISEEYDNKGYMGYDVLYNDTKPAEGDNVKFVTSDSIEVNY